MKKEILTRQQVASEAKRRRADFEAMVVKAITNTSATHAEIASLFGLHPVRVSQIARKYNVLRPRGPRPK